MSDGWRTLDLFCGAAGGWTLGLHRAGFTTVAACEIDPWRRAVFGQNNPGVKLYDDVRTLTATRLLDDLGYVPEIVCGSPPCQDASVANTRGRGVDGERTGLFFEAIRIVREVRPRWVLLENVPGLRARGYDRVHDELEAAGYAVWPLVVGAVHAGAPHLRKRVWIVARRVRSAPVADAIGRGELEPQRGISHERRRAGDLVAQAWTVADADSGGIRQQLLHGQAPSIVANDAPLESHDGWRPALAAWAQWNGGTLDLGRVDDGLSEALAGRRGLGRACLAAYGDAVVPQITEAIGRAVRRVDLMEAS